MRVFSLLFCVLALLAVPTLSPALERTQAEQIVQDTHSARCYAGVAVEADFQKPENIVVAALWGAYDAKAWLGFAQEQRKEKGLAPGPDILFEVNGTRVHASAVQGPDDNPAHFQGLPLAQVFMESRQDEPERRLPYNVFVSREAAELAALRYTGHNLPAGVVPEHIMGASVLAREEGYFFVVDGIGDTGEEAILASVIPQGRNYVLVGELRNNFADEGGSSKKNFRLELAPGEAAGTWKRLSWTEAESK